MEEEKIYRFGDSPKRYIFLDGEYIRIRNLNSIWNILFNNKCFGKWILRKWNGEIEKNSRNFDRNIRYEINSPFHIYKHLDKAIDILTGK